MFLFAQFNCINLSKRFLNLTAPEITKAIIPKKMIEVKIKISNGTGFKKVPRQKDLLIKKE
jgi:hypothetical protein